MNVTVFATTLKYSGGHQGGTDRRWCVERCAGWFCGGFLRSFLFGEGW